MVWPEVIHLIKHSIIISYTSFNLHIDAHRGGGGGGRGERGEGGTSCTPYKDF
jgi:hypothetical protein